MRRLAAVTALAVLAGTAHADHTTVRAVATQRGSERGFAVASRTAGDLRVDVLESDPSAGAPVLHVGLSDGKSYWTAAQAVDAVRSDCGAGKCVTQAVTRETIEIADGVAWVRFEVVNEIDHNDPEASDHDFTTHTTAVMACSLPGDHDAPRCAWYRPGVSQSSRIDVSGTTLTVTAATGTVETVELHLDREAVALR